MTLICQCTDDRRGQLLDTEEVNGIDFVRTYYRDRNSSSVEVLFFRHLAVDITSRNVWIVDTRRQHDLEVVSNPIPCDNSLEIHVVRPRVGTTYRLRLVEVDSKGRRTGQPLPGIDPRHSEIEFSFYHSGKQRTDFDPQVPPELQMPTRQDPDINYLAKDYASFRQLILDRLAQTMPNWQERHAADLGITVIELMAYVADRLSYFQDAVATDSYLETARQRISVRRHARLVDYRVHEGCNARALVHLHVESDVGLAPANVFFMTTPPEHYQLRNQVYRAEDLPAELYQEVVVFEPVVSPRFDGKLAADDIKDTVALANLIYAAADNVALYITTRITAELWDQLGQCGATGTRGLSEQTVHELVKQLNGIFRDDQLLPVALNEERLAAEALQIQRKMHGHSRGAVNRAVFDVLAGELVSPARLDTRIRLYQAHNEIRFYTWGEAECWLPKGTTTATLVDSAAPDDKSKRALCSPLDNSAGQRLLDHLARGDLLILEEVKGPKTGSPHDADPHHRQAVRLTKVERRTDPVTGYLIVEIQWHAEDALRFDLCISSRRDVPHCDVIHDVSVARGNIVLADHGRTVSDEDLGQVNGRWEQVDCDSGWKEPGWDQQREPFRPVLQEARLTFAHKIDAQTPASSVLHADPEEALPSISLRGIPAVPATATPAALPLRPQDFDMPSTLLQHIQQWQQDDRRRHLTYIVESLLELDLAFELSRAGTPKGRAAADADLGDRLAKALDKRTSWSPQFDLMGSDDESRHFVVEMDNQRRAHLRFGDGQHGRQPDVGMRFSATYRVGNGVGGNVGAGAIARLVTRDGSGAAVSQVRNPLPAGGGVDPESLSEVKLYAPHQFRAVQHRAILADDYADLVMREFRPYVQNAKAAISWAGTYWRVEVAIDPLSNVRDFDKLRDEIQSSLQRYRRIGHRVRVGRGVNVPLDLRMTVCVLRDYQQSAVRNELMALFSNRELAEGRRGLFHPDELTFGQPVHVSRLVAAAKKVPGVENVLVTHLSRLGMGRAANVAKDEIQVDPQTGPEIMASAPNVLELAPLEIAQLDNTGSGETGRFCLTLEGGR